MTLTADQVPPRIPRAFSPANNDGRLLALLTGLLIAATWPFLGGFTAVALAAGGATSLVIRWWINRHPSELPTPNGRPRRNPELNMSSIPVGGDAGGLILVVGCLAVFLLGLPALRTFMLAAILFAAALATVLILWRQRHELWTRPTTSLRARNGF